MKRGLSITNDPEIVKGSPNSPTAMDVVYRAERKPKKRAPCLGLRQQSRFGKRWPAIELELDHVNS